MTTTEESPIVVQSEDESDDGDDVIVIKEEPPVEDNDVIFVSASLPINKLEDTTDKSTEQDKQILACDSTCDIDTTSTSTSPPTLSSTSIANSSDVAADVETNLVDDVFGNGIDQLLRAACYTATSPGDDVLTLNKPPAANCVVPVAGTSQGDASQADTVAISSGPSAKTSVAASSMICDPKSGQQSELTNPTLNSAINLSSQVSANSLSTTTTTNGATTDLYTATGLISPVNTTYPMTRHDLVDPLQLCKPLATLSPLAGITVHTDTKDEAFQQIEKYVRLLAETDNKDKMCQALNPLQLPQPSVTANGGQSGGITPNYASISNLTQLNGPSNTDNNISNKNNNNINNSNQLTFKTQGDIMTNSNQVSVSTNNNNNNHSISSLCSQDVSNSSSSHSAGLASVASCSFSVGHFTSACNTNQGADFSRSDRILSSLISDLASNAGSATLQSQCLSATKATDLSQETLPPRKRYKSMDFQSPASDPPQLKRSKDSEDVCVKCLQGNLKADSLSCCSVGHISCDSCIQKHTTQVLLEKTKCLLCLEESCHGVYSIPELRKTLPKMVIEVLEKRELENIIEETSDERQKDEHHDFPPEWAPIEERSTLKIVPLDNDDMEFMKVAIRFYETMNGNSFFLHRILRVQNVTLWRYYNLKKIEMVHENDGLEVQEERLFHGTQGQCVDAITKKGFDWRLSGKHGSMYGEGSYFAKNALYSHDYTDYPHFKQQKRHKKRYQRLRKVCRSKCPFYTPPPAHQSLHPIAYNPTFNPQPAHQHLYPATNTSSTSSYFTAVNPSLPFAGSYNPFPFQQLSANSLIASPIVNLPQPAPISAFTNLNDPNDAGNCSSLYGLADLNAPSLFRGSTVSEPEADASKEPEYLLKMFMCRVLVGKSTGGQKGYRKPPPLDPERDKMGRCYDSCVDKIFNPDIWVVFDSHQSYPEYLVEYTCAELSD